MLRVASTIKMKLLSTKKRTNYPALETASFVIIGRPFVVLSTGGRHSERIMKVLPVFNASTMAVFSSSTLLKFGNFVAAVIGQKNLWTGEGDSLPSAFRRRFPRRAGDPGSAERLFSGCWALRFLPSVAALDLFAGV
jgi:hypothetical protein